ncbi:CUB domain-containing protein 1 isoform X2 [Pseudophryne corroboree]|uniref:CUB domain-containing protein 1 isoform X2 n=1 Tax=Pseudophryne corroboree TaxID=495146 RepID=UPI0030816BBF
MARDPDSGYSAMMLLGLLLGCLLSRFTESINISLQPAQNITVRIKRGNNLPPAQCYICKPNNICKDSNLEILPGMKVDYTFSCTTPERYFIMEINRTIDCSSGLCPLNITLQPSSLSGLNRTFFWHILASRNSGLKLSFSTPWLRQVHPSSTCPDLVNCKISTFVRDTSIDIGTFCRNGTVTSIKVQEKGVVALSLPSFETLVNPGFSIANRTSIQRLGIVESTFQQESLVNLLSANYPHAFPRNEKVTWKFNLPPAHAASVEFLNYTMPKCVKNEVNVEYYLPKRSLLKLDDKQHANIQNNFNFSLQNCEVDNSLPGLALNFSVTIQKSQGDTMYHLDLTREKDLVVRIGKRKTIQRRFTPVCVICKGLADCDTELVLEGGKYYRISFLCNNINSLTVTAEKEIACWDIKVCNISNVSLNIPKSLVEFPVRLETYTWKLIAPEHISTEIASKSIYLQQHVDDKPCNVTTSGFTYDIFSCTDRDQFKIGTFCPNGSIEKVQMRDNVTIIMNIPWNGNPKKLLEHDLHVSFVSFIKEECIFTVSPKTRDTVYLQTPNWDIGLPDYVSLSWSINLPKKLSGKVKFSKDKMDIICETGSAYVNIKEQGSNGLAVVRREDEQLPSPMEIYSPFWINISNCKPFIRRNKLKMQMSIIFSQVSPDLKTILIAAASAVAVVLAVIVTVCCIKRKKKQKESPVGIYDARVNTEVPRRHAIFKKGRKSNESHVYAVIDDTMIYGHLLQETNGLVPEVDVYQPFEGRMGDAPPVPPITFPNGSTREDKVEDLLAHSMKKNDIYNFCESFSRQPVENEDTSISYIEESGNGTVISA